MVLDGWGGEGGRDTWLCNEPGKAREGGMRGCLTRAMAMVAKGKWPLPVISLSIPNVPCDGHRAGPLRSFNLRGSRDGVARDGYLKVPRLAYPQLRRQCRLRTRPTVGASTVWGCRRALLPTAGKGSGDSHSRLLARRCQGGGGTGKGKGWSHAARAASARGRVPARGARGRRPPPRLYARYVAASIARRCCAARLDGAAQRD